MSIWCDFGVTFPMVKNASPEGDKTSVGQFLSAHSACATGVKITQGMVPHAGIPKFTSEHLLKNMKLKIRFCQMVTSEHFIRC